MCVSGIVREKRNLQFKLYPWHFPPFVGKTTFYSFPHIASFFSFRKEFSSYTCRLNETSWQKGKTKFPSSSFDARSLALSRKSISVKTSNDNRSTLWCQFRFVVSTTIGNFIWEHQRFIARVLEVPLHSKWQSLSWDIKRANRIERTGELLSLAVSCFVYWDRCVEKSKSG